MTGNLPIRRSGRTRRHSTRFVVPVVALGLFCASAIADTTPKVYDCGGRKMELSEPKDGILQARIEDFSVEITIKERRGTVAARYIVSVTGPRAGPGTQTNAREVSEALDSACRIVAQYYKSLEQPSAEDLAKELLEFYDDL